MSARLMTVAETAVLLRVSVNTVRRWLASGKLAGSKPGRAVLIDPSDVARLIESKPACTAGGIR